MQRAYVATRARGIRHELLTQKIKEYAAAYGEWMSDPRRRQYVARMDNWLREESYLNSYEPSKPREPRQPRSKKGRRGKAAEPKRVRGSQIIRGTAESSYGTVGLLKRPKNPQSGYIEVVSKESGERWATSMDVLRHVRWGRDVWTFA